MNPSNLKLIGWRWWLASFLPYRVRAFWNRRIRTIHAPQHDELRASIPRYWMDLDTIMTDFLYACVISFVELEKGLESWDYQKSEHPAKQNSAMLREVFVWAKTGRAAFEAKIMATYPPLSKLGGLKGLIEDVNRDAVDYTEVWALEREFEALDTKYLQWIVTNRQLFWV